jgi:ribosomal protein L29
MDQHGDLQIQQARKEIAKILMMINSNAGVKA